jgi:hypothetical protein
LASNPGRRYLLSEQESVAENQLLQEEFLSHEKEAQWIGTINVLMELLQLFNDPFFLWILSGQHVSSAIVDSQ